MTSALGSEESKKLPGAKRSATVETEAVDVLLEDRADLGKIEADAGEVGMGEGNLGGGVALRGADVYEGLVVRPGEFGGDGDVQRRG